MSGLTKQHFNKIAEIIFFEMMKTEEGKKEFSVNGLILSLSEYFKTQNPLFDESRFKKACLEN